MSIKIRLPSYLKGMFANFSQIQQALIYKLSSK